MNGTGLLGTPLAPGLRPFDSNDSQNRGALGALDSNLKPINPGTLVPKPAEPVDDPVTVDPTAQSVADLRAIIDKLKNAVGGNAVKGALTSLKNFIDKNTGANFTGGVLGEVSKFVDNVLGALDKDPNALGSFSLNINAAFTQSTVRSEDYYDRNTSFAFNLSFTSDNVSFNANLAFTEQLTKTADGVRYQSSESAQISLTGYSAARVDNPAAEAFSAITQLLLGQDPLAIVTGNTGTPTKPPVAAAPTKPPAAQLQNILQQLQDRLKSLGNNSDAAETLIEFIRKFLEQLHAQHSHGGSEPLPFGNTGAQAA